MIGKSKTRRAAGRLGLGVKEPAAKLDVAGLIRTSEGILFPDGTVQKTAAGPGFVAIGGYGLNTDRTISILTRERTSVIMGSASSRGASKAGREQASGGAMAPVYGNEVGTNTWYGENAGHSITSGYRDSFFGNSAGYANTTGGWNSFFGWEAGKANTTGSENSFFGYIAGTSNTTARYNSFFGSQAGYWNTTGQYNSFFGSLAGASNSTGGYNSFFGVEAGVSNSTGGNNCFFGFATGHYNAGGANNSFVGYQAGYSNMASDNSFFGYNAGYANTSGTGNVFVGNSAGAANTTANYNSFFGYNAGNANTSGTSNAFFGESAGYSNTTANYNSFFGSEAGKQNTTGSANSFVGRQAGYNNAANGNSFFGTSAGYANTSGTGNAFFGKSTGTLNTTGDYNSFFGALAGAGNTTGGSNSFFGYDAGHYNYTGGSNSFFGYHAGDSNTTQDNNSFIGAYSDGAAGITNATAIGYRANVTQSNSLVLGSINGVNGATANTFVGIGTTSPLTELQVLSTKSTQPRGISSYQYSNDNLSAIMRGGKARGTASAPSAVQAGDGIFNTQADGYGATQFLYNVGGFQFAAEATFTDTSAPTYWRVLTTPAGATLATEKIRITSDGKVGIGTTAPTERLHVVGNLRVTGNYIAGAPEIDIPDYVFEPTYKLMRIEELEKFIRKEKHLPNIPQATEIKEKGLNLSEFQMKLLEKIEELTLYTVQQAKTINRKDEEIKDLSARLTVLEQTMERMTKGEAREEK